MVVRRNILLNHDTNRELNQTIGSPETAQLISGSAVVANHQFHIDLYFSLNYIAAIMFVAKLRADENIKNSDEVHIATRFVSSNS